MSDLQALYKEVILDHNTRPRNFGTIQSANKKADGNNTICGDSIHIDVLDEDHTISDIQFSGKGCAISKASASIMTELIKGKDIENALELFHAFHEYLISKDKDFPSTLPEKLRVFSGIKDYPMRIKCAILPWHTMKAALEGSTQTVSTE